MSSCDPASHLLGLIPFGSCVPDADALTIMASAMSPTADGSRPVRPARFIRTPGAGLGCVLTHSSPDTRPAFPYRHPDTGVLVSGIGFLQAREVLWRSLAADARRPVPADDGELIALAYLRWGEDFPAHLQGEFALVIWDPRQQSALLTRDALGCRPLFYQFEDGLLRVTSDPNGVLATWPEIPDLGEHWLLSMLTNQTISHEDYAYAGLKRALPGHVHGFTAAGARQHRYWAPTSQPVMLASDSDYETALREHFFAAVRARLPDASEPAGCELSGGLDSSSVTAVAARLRQAQPETLYAFSHMLPDALLDKVWPLRDERDWSTSLCRHAGIRQHVAITGEGRHLLDDLRQTIRVLAAPPHSGYATLPQALYADAAGRGVHILLSGYGGDELVTSKSSLVPESWVRRGDWRRLVASLRLEGDHAPRHDRPRLLLRLARLVLPHHQLWRQTMRIRDKKARQLEAQLPVEASWRARVVQAYHASSADFVSLVRAGEQIRHDHYKLRDPGMSLRMEMSHLEAVSHGLSLRYPMLDQPLLAFSLGLPPEQRWRLGLGRHLFRRSMRGVLPEPLRWRNDKQSFTVPNQLGRLLDQRHELQDLLARARALPELAFLDHDALARGWLDRLAAAETGTGSTTLKQTPGIHFRLLALLAFHDLRHQGWRPGQAAADIRPHD